MHEVCNTTSFDTLSNEVTINADKSVGRLPYLTKPTSTGDRSSSVGMCTVEAAQLDRPWYADDITQITLRSDLTLSNKMFSCST